MAEDDKKAEEEAARLLGLGPLGPRGPNDKDERVREELRKQAQSIQAAEGLPGLG
jgi:hypothetical protein